MTEAEWLACGNPMPMLEFLGERARDRKLRLFGCNSPDVLDHCRDANHVHARGCWAVDLVLGKS